MGDVSISLGKANLLAIPFAILGVIVVLGPYLLVWGSAELSASFNRFSRLPVFIPSFLIGVVLHELLHGVGWMVFGRQPARNIRFGFQLKTLTPYAHCMAPVSASAYRAGTALPGIALGLIPALFGIVTGNWFATMFGTLFTVAACGDALIIWVIRSVPGKTLVRDHPKNAGCVIEEPVGMETTQSPAS
jgi:hypothetical protein